MQFHYNHTLERVFHPQTEVMDTTPAWLAIFLVQSLRRWFGQPHRILERVEGASVLIGYEVLALPTEEFFENDGPLIAAIDKAWPVQVFGVANNGELVELSIVERGGSFLQRQRSISGVWHEDVRDLYLSFQFPDPLTANGFSQLLQASESEQPVVAMDWKYADFLEQQKLAAIDHTLSFCYVPLSENLGKGKPLAYLASLTMDQKQALWRLFLERGIYPPEFEWVWDTLHYGTVPNWMEWVLTLYRALEQLQIQFVCNGTQFSLLDSAGKRLYFGVDHWEAAEQVLMKVLFPLNQ